MKDWKAAIRTWENRTKPNITAGSVDQFLKLLGDASRAEMNRGVVLRFKDYDLFQVANEYTFSLQEKYMPTEKSRAAFADKELWAYLKAKL